ncbi:hypothetical protein [Xenorhabdus bovienii]|uniref:hypothetical protein n=1 Tax=Xenorhabdus bovienii TaxID=40576 RepID=UPI0023B28F55|nr:hypothetical protein [Xenorhabdus bovienii]MDE9543584.1 hypothetical protein [Xenorhabdus bovienii]
MDNLIKILNRGKVRSYSENRRDDFDYYLVTNDNAKILMAVRAYHGYGKKFYRVSPANE